MADADRQADGPDDGPGTGPGTPPPANAQTHTIVNDRGLHARAAAKFAECAEAFDCEITVSNGRDDVPGKSLMGLLMLGASKGAEITVRACGRDAEAALKALGALIADGFGESAG